jgi:TonB family protein
MYSPREVASAAGVPPEVVVAALGASDGFISHADALRLAREVRARTPGSAAVFSIFARDPTAAAAKSVPLAVSGTIHATVVLLAVFAANLGIAPIARTLPVEDQPAKDMRLVFMNIPGAGGGGGGGGARQKLPPPKAKREGRSSVSSPMPPRRPLQPVEPPPEPKPPEPPPPLKSEAMPIVSAPIVQAPADDRSRAGVFQEARSEAQSRGSGAGGGAGSGTGTGIGPGDGSGVGPGSGGGTGGGPFRPGSGIQPPRLLREVRADYTEDARRRGLEGEVVLEIIVRRDGSVGDVRFVRRLGAGLDDRAVQAVRQWRFAPARRLGEPVDVIVEVAVEFRLR